MRFSWVGAKECQQWRVEVDGVKTALVVGAGRGIGLALSEEILKKCEGSLVFATERSPGASPGLSELQAQYGEDRLSILGYDALEEKSAHLLREQFEVRSQRLDLLISSLGFLHDSRFSPERRLEEIDETHLIRSFQVNALSFLKVAEQFKQFLQHSDCPRVFAISAKVGSLSDNRSGGWYSYRMSKAALNMAVKNLSIEWGRMKNKPLVLALHPGTTRTQLSEPFLRSASKKYQIHSSQETAENLFKVVSGLGSESSGRFLSWDGSEIPW